MIKTFQYKAKVNKTTNEKADKWLDLCCWLYNTALEQRKMVYKNNNLTLSAYTQHSELPSLKKELPEFKQVGSQVLQDVIDRLDKAYKSFFRRVKNGETPGVPRFKSRNRYDSFTLKQTGWKLEGRNIIIKNIGRFKLFLSRPIEGNIKTITIRKTATGKWFVSFSCDNVPEKKLEPNNKSIGLDVGLNSFVVDSDGNKVDNPRFLRKSEKELRRKQRSLYRKKKGSNRRNKAKLFVAKVHEKITNQRKDFLHKTVNYFVKNYGAIVVEDLNIKDMVKNHKLAKSISDASWSIFIQFLSYKAEEAGRIFEKVNPRNTSQICSNCGEKVVKSLAVRTHKCPYCGLVMDRDKNAAINILSRAGQTLQTLTCPVGECVV